MSNIEVLMPPLIQRMPPAVAALLAHLPGLSLAVALLLAGVTLPGGVIALGVGGAAAWFAHRWALPRWWTGINLAFTPLLWTGLQYEFDPAWFLAAFVLLLLTSLGAVVTRVPLYLSSPRAAEALAERLPQDGQMIDLGCGLGGPLARIASRRADARLQGVEAAPLNWLIAHLRLIGRADIRLGSLWDCDLGDADLVYTYLSPAPMARLWTKARREMRPGSLLVSNSFAIPDVQPDEVIDLDDRARTRLLVWRMR